MALGPWSRRTTRRSAAATVLVLTVGYLGVSTTTPAAQAAVPDPAALVNTLIGSSNNGETFPGSVVPYGMVQWSPENSGGNQTRTVEPGGYSYDVTKIRGFALTHMSGTGCAGGYGDIPFFPHVGAVNSSPTSDTTDAKYASTFTHANEIAQAGYYSVKLNNGSRTELTTTARTGSGRFTYPAGQTASLLVRTSNSEVGSSNAQVSIDAANRTIRGSVTSGNFCGYINAIGRRSYYTAYFTAEFDSAFTSTGTWKDGTLSAGSTTSSGGTTYGTDGWPVAGKGSGGYVTFDAGKTVNVRVGLSFVSAANADANLAAENPTGTTFETVKQKAHDAWNTRLGRIQTTGGSSAQQSTFYTALYHSLLHPNIFSDVNGQYVGMDQKVHSLSAGQKAQYANFSGWDAYRSQVQLIGLIEPDVAGDIAQSLLNQADQNNGVWDRWTHGPGGTHVMTGDPGHSAIASLYAFGGTNFNAQSALTSMVKAATTVTADDLSRSGWNVMVVGERPSLDVYLAKGYVPSNGNAWGGAGETLEDAVADFGIAQLAGKLGDTANATKFSGRAQNWKNVFNPNAHSTGGYIQERNSSGSWNSFDPASSSGFAEGSAAQYTWMVPHNPRGLFDAMGGNAKANTRLDNFFHKPDGSWALSKSGGLYSELDNEPSVNVPYLYNYSGQPWKAQQTVRQVVNTLWNNGPSGIPGQDDLGAMSSWYVWSAMGIYPQAPGRADLVLGSPLFSQVVISRSNGKTITINAPAAATNAPYVQSLKVDGAASTKTFVPESFVANGGTLDFVLGTTANTSWGTAASDAPPSFPAGPVVPPVGIRDNRGISTDTNAAGANYDNLGYSYSSQALAAAGVMPGSTVTAGGSTFTWPNVTPGQFDNYAAKGQTIDLASSPAGATKLAFLGSSSGGSTSGTVTVTYTDGTTTTADLGLTDWAVTPAKYGNIVAVTTAYRNHPNGKQTIKVYAFATTPIALNTAKRIKSVTLPGTFTGNGVMHVFAVGVG